MILKPLGTPGKCPAHCRNWKPEHDDFLVKNYSVMDIADIAAVLNRTASAVEERSKYLRAKGFPVPYRSKNKPLTLKERQFIRDNRYTMTARQMAARLNRHKVTITKTARKMGISLRKLGDYNPCTRYKDEDVRLIRALRECTPPITFREIGKKFDMSKNTVEKLYRRRYTADEAIAREYLPR
ncbi:TPA: AsnC family protein [Salmonella enterica]|uniref:AsnC family protein n=1 Tax=Salmonella enterica TaxID=28901 RepID=A0A743PER8_SALER|nr:AsnC family protein [Salmonella enterica]